MIDINNHQHGFIRSEAEYEALQAHEHRLKVKETGCEIPLSAESYAGVKEEMNEVQQIVDTLISNICKMKV
jgi:hypothetical protein